MKRNYYIVALIMLTFFVISFVTNVIGPLVPGWVIFGDCEMECRFCI